MAILRYCFPHKEAFVSSNQILGTQSNCPYLSVLKERHVHSDQGWKTYMVRILLSPSHVTKWLSSQADEKQNWEENTFVFTRTPSSRSSKHVPVYTHTHVHTCVCAPLHTHTHTPPFHLLLLFLLPLSRIRWHFQKSAHSIRAWVPVTIKKIKF